MLNPTLSDLIGGIQSVTLGDEEARRRRTQKSVLERKAPPTFDVIVEIVDRERVAVHADVADTIDAMLRGDQVSARAPLARRGRRPSQPGPAAAVAARAARRGALRRARRGRLAVADGARLARRRRVPQRRLSRGRSRLRRPARLSAGRDRRLAIVARRVRPRAGAPAAPYRRVAGPARSRVNGSRRRPRLGARRGRRDRGAVRGRRHRRPRTAGARRARRRRPRPGRARRASCSARRPGATRPAAP